MSEDVLICVGDTRGLHWPSTCVSCGAPVAAAAADDPFATPSAPACDRHARSQAVARWILSPTPGVLALRVPVFLGFGWLGRFVLTTLHTHADWSTALAAISPMMRVLFVYGLVGAAALLWADRTAALRIMFPDASRQRTLLRFRRPESAHEFRALNPDVVVAAAKPTPWWLRDSPSLVLAFVAVLVVVLEVVHPLKAH